MAFADQGKQPLLTPGQGACEPCPKNDCDKGHDMGWQIVSHSFGLVFRNVGAALRVSIGPYILGILIAVVVAFALGLPLAQVETVAASPDQIDPAFATAIIIWVFIAVLLFLAISAWVAVAWHRFVLLEENPGLVPEFSTGRIGAYAWRIVLQSIALLLISVVLMLGLGLLMSPLFMLVAPSAGSEGGAGLLIIGGVYALILTAAIGWVWMRMGMTLPSVALDREMSIGESFSLTAPYSGTIFSAVVILAFINIGATIVLEVVFGSSILYGILSLILNWISVMVGISILTSLYGIIVEKRSIT
jgi:hypothetical protein